MKKIFVFLVIFLLSITVVSASIFSEDQQVFVIKRSSTTSSGNGTSGPEVDPIWSAAKVNYFTKSLYWINATLSFLRINDQRYNDTLKINNLNSSLDNRYWNENGDTGLTGNYVGNYNLILNNGYVNSNYLQLNTTYTNGHNAGRIQWNIDEGTPEVGMAGGQVNQQIGLELLVRGKNKESFIIPNGRVVYDAGTTGENPELKVANNNNINQAMRVIGMTTEDINQWGYVTTYGKVHDVDTTSFNNSDLLWLATNGTVTNIRPVSPNIQYVIGIVVHSNINGTIYVKPVVISRMQYLSDVYCPSIINNSILQWDSSNSRFKCTINPMFNNVTASNFNGNWNGSTILNNKIILVNNTLFDRYTVQKEPTGFVNTTSSNLYFFNTTRIFKINGTYDIYWKGKKIHKTSQDNVTIPSTAGTINYIYFNGSGVLKNSTSPWNNDFYNVVQVATVFYNGTIGLIGRERHGLSMDGATHYYLHTTRGTQYKSGFLGTFTAANNFQIASGTIEDEDNIDDNPATNYTRVFYHKSANKFTFTVRQKQLYYNVSNILRYDTLTGTADVTNNRYVAYWIVETTDRDNPTYTIMGQREDITLTNAQTNNQWNTMNLTGFDFPEYKVLYRVILRRSGTAVPIISDIQDLRNVPTLNSVSNNVDDDSMYLLLDGTRNMTGNLNMGGKNITANTFKGNWNGSSNYYTKLQINNNFTNYFTKLLYWSNLTSTLANYFTKTAYWTNATTTFYTKAQINNNFSKYNNRSVDLASDKLLWQNRTDWTTHDNYPAACPAGQYVTQIGDTLTCSTPSSSAGGSFFRQTILYDDFTFWATARTNGVGICALVGTGGTAAVVLPKDRRVGRVSFLDSTTANSGYYCNTDIGIFYFTGGERITVGFDLPNVANVLNTTIIMGSGDIRTAAEPTDGCYLYSFNRNAQGRCKNNAGPTKTATNITLAQNQNYLLDITANSAATSVLFSVYNYTSCTNYTQVQNGVYSTCTLKWNSTVGGNIPNAAGRDTGILMNAWQSSTSAAAILVNWDFIKFEK